MAVPFRVKICGVTNSQDARQAALLGASAVGLNFYAGSPRYIDPASAAAIVQSLPTSVECVGVFVNEPLQSTIELATRIGGIRTLQVHGENAELGAVPPFHLLPAFAVRDEHSLLAISAFLERSSSSGWLPDAILVDAHLPGHYGGTGLTAPWGLLADFHPRVPLILAGGLTPENVAEAIRIVQPNGVDVASGVEIRPGVKNPSKMQRFIENAREAFARLGGA